MDTGCDSFFAYLQEDLPPGSGFAPYSAIHVAFLAGIAAVCVAACLAFRRTSPRRRQLVLRVVATACLALQLGGVAVVLATLPTFPITQLPLHLCGINIYVQFVHAFWPNKTTGEILYSLSLPGAAAALLFPGWTIYPACNFFFLQSFLMHGLLVCFPLLLLAGGLLRPSARRLWRPAVFLLIVTPPVYFLNHVWNTNFFFINFAMPGSPLAFLQQRMGNPGYLLGYAGLVAAVWLVLYLPWSIHSHIMHKKDV